MTHAVRHPIFARVYARLAPMEEARGAAEHRSELLADLRGRVVEVGAGSAINFHFAFERTKPIPFEVGACARTLEEA